MKKSILLLLISIISLPAFAQSDELKQIIDQRADEIEEQVIEWRRHFHENPELSNREFETAAYIAEYLNELGLEVETEVAHTGVVAVLEGGQPGSLIGLRADIDASCNGANRCSLQIRSHRNVSGKGSWGNACLWPRYPHRHADGRC